jgi:hypothetical protein
MRTTIFEELFNAEMALVGAIRYCRHMQAVTKEHGYYSAESMLSEALARLNRERKKIIRQRQLKKAA